MTTENNNLERSYLKQRLFEKIKDNLIDLPAYRLTEKQKEMCSSVKKALSDAKNNNTTESRKKNKISWKRICSWVKKAPSSIKKALSDTKNNNKTESREENNISSSLLDYESELEQLDSSWNRIGFSFTSFLNQENKICKLEIKNSCWLVPIILFLLLGFLTRIDNQPCKIIGGVSLLVWEILFIKFSFDYNMWYSKVESVCNIFSTFIKTIDDYINAFEKFYEPNLQKKADILSKSIVEDEISSLNYRLRKVDIYTIATALAGSLLIAYVAGDTLSWGITNIAQSINFGDSEFIKQLNLEKLITLILFPFILNSSKEIFITDLQKRNQRLKQSLLILENRIQNRI